MLLDPHRTRLDALTACHPTGLATPLGALQSILQPNQSLGQRRPDRQIEARQSKGLPNLTAVFDRFDIADGQTLSFHHHYRNGDRVMTFVLQEAQRRGLKNLTIAPSSLFPVHAPLVPLLEDETITHIVTDYMRGPVADAVAAGKLLGTALLQSHGGRARALSTGQLSVDVAFIAAPLANRQGDTTGRGGQLPCGPLGYPAVDAAHARHAVVLTDLLIDGPLPNIDIPGHHVDAIVQMESPGSTDGIQSGTTIAAESATARLIGGLVADCLEAAGAFTPDFSLQSGAGGYSLGAVVEIGKRMAETGVKGQFLSGGITGAHVALVEQGLFAEIHDVQCFDGAAVRSSIHNPLHHMMTAETYASPLLDTARVNALSAMLLGAVEVDAGFNVNVVVGADGRMLGGPGGHPDAAAGAAISIVTTELTGGGYAKLVPEVQAVVTPGHSVDVIVTDQGIAVNPARPDLGAAFREARLPVRSFAALQHQAAAQADRTASQLPPLEGRSFHTAIEAR
ncbi:MAG: citrate lyase subunit alpha, partial [Rhodospirillaceae bacterium]